MKVGVLGKNGCGIATRNEKERSSWSVGFQRSAEMYRVEGISEAAEDEDVLAAGEELERGVPNQKGIR